MFPRANVGPKSFKYRQDRVDKGYKNSVIYFTIVNPQPSCHYEVPAELE